jgi:hypothetical protein
MKGETAGHSFAVGQPADGDAQALAILSLTSIRNPRHGSGGMFETREVMIGSDLLGSMEIFDRLRKDLGRAAPGSGPPAKEDIAMLDGPAVPWRFSAVFSPVRSGGADTVILQILRLYA